MTRTQSGLETYSGILGDRGFLFAVLLIRSGPECANSSFLVLGSGEKLVPAWYSNQGTLSRLATRYSIRLNCLSNCSEQNRTSATERSKAPNCFSFACNTNSFRASCTCSKARDKRAPRVPKLSRNDCRSGADGLTRFPERYDFGCSRHASARSVGAGQDPEIQHPAPAGQN